MKELTTLSIIEAAELIQRRELSVVDLTNAHLERINKIDPLINSFIHIMADQALASARQAEIEISREGPRSLLHGIPLGLKDLYDMRGAPTTAGSKFFVENHSAQDAFVVHRLQEAGAVILGKLNMHEIALGVTNVNPHFGVCRNPWDRVRVTGGSSGGSAAALVAGLCMGSLGSDTGGSIRIPASLCGIVGLKPTFGRVSLRGVIPLSWNLDHAGPMARGVRDTAVLLQAIGGYDPQDPSSSDVPAGDYLDLLENGVQGWRIALASDEFFTKVTDPEIWAGIHASAGVFEVLGAQVEPVEFPQARQAARANGLMTTSDAATFHQERLQNHPEDFGEDVLTRLSAGAAYTSSEYINARRTQTVLRRRYEEFFADYDILITPTTPIPAPLIEGPDAVEQARVLTRFTAPFNLTGLPALSLPCGFTSAGLPIGLQIISHPWGETKVLQAGYAYEQATGWNKRSPNLPVGD
jgi:aspartyl-tRNA(Asn)/glutamyl-tRNA(Gln) amidotransferase subunit A